MSLVLKLVSFGLRQVFDAGDQITGVIEQHLTDHSQTLPRALATANDRAWKALGIALAGNGLFDRVKVWLTASGDEKGFREQVNQFLVCKGVSFEGSPEDFRQACLGDLNKAFKAKALSSEKISPREIATQVALQRYHEPQALTRAAEEIVAQMARELEPQYPNLARLLGQPTRDGPPLLVSAFAFFFRREVEKDEELAHGLFFDSLKRLSANQAGAFKGVGEALDRLGERFNEAIENVLEKLEQARIAAEQERETTAATQKAVLDMQAELQHQGVNNEEIRLLILKVMSQLSQGGMQQGEVKPRHSFSIRGDVERRAVKAFIARFRQLQPDEQEKLPALLNGLGKLQIGAGDFGGAKDTFEEVASIVRDDAAKAEAYYNAYRAALEEKQWDAALEEIQQAATLDPGRFAPFPMNRYRPQRILGAGGFGTAYLCQDVFFRGREVVVKALHASDLERRLKDVFAEAHVLTELNHPAIIGVLDCSYADLAALSRPYIVMPYFRGVSLEAYVREHGPLPIQGLVAIASQIAAGMKEAHAQGILHRDLKPDNVLVHTNGNYWQAKIIDFGVAMRRQVIEMSMAARSGGNTILSDSVAGSLKYAPPEQMGELRGVKAGPYSDVYSFGKTCCYALFRTTEPKRRQWSSIPEELADVLEKCIEHEIAQRHPNFEPVLVVFQALDRVEQRRREQEDERRQQEKLRRQLEATEKQKREAEQRRQEEAHRKAGEQRRKQEEEDERHATSYEDRAKVHLLNDDLTKAVVEATEAIRLNAKAGTAYGCRGEAYHRKGEWDLAIADLTEAIRFKPMNAESYYLRGDAYHMKNEYDKAIADLTEALRIDPTIADVHHWRGAAYHRKGEYDKAIFDLNEALRLNPNDVAAYRWRGESYYRKGEFDLAIADLTKYINYNPNDAEAYGWRNEAEQKQTNQIHITPA